MVHILVEKAHNRIIYTLSIIFETIFKLPHKIIYLPCNELNTKIFTLNYSEYTIENTLKIPNQGLLTQVDKHTSFFLDTSKSFEENWGISPSISDAANIFPFDIFSAVFYLVSDYEKYSLSFFDFHLRYDEICYPSHQMKLYEQPTVHILCEKLLTYFPKNLQEAVKKHRKYDYEITFDIDNPWKHKHKHFAIQLAGFVKDVLRCNKANLSERWNIIKGRKDVNDTFDTIMAICPPQKTRFFCLIDRHSGYDTRFTYQHAIFRSFIQRLYHQGYAIGIHPSYTSFDSPEKIHFETSKLSQIVNISIKSSRQHFLRYRLPNTFNYLIAAGITDDYTLCLRNNIGFPCGMSVPFTWYDVEKEEITTLTLHPTLVMDRALQQYMKLTPQKALEKVVDLIYDVKNIGGKMTIVLHNESLSEAAEWRGWSDCLKKIIQDIIYAYDS